MDAVIGIVVLLVIVAVGAGLLKLAVYVFSPHSPNGFWRAVIALILMSVGPLLAGAALLKVSVILGLLTFFLGPFFVLRTAYGMSFFRAIFVQLLFSAIMYVGMGAIGTAGGREEAVEYAVESEP